MEISTISTGDTYQTPPKAKATFRRKARESVLSPSSLRASKLNKITDDVLFEKVQMMIQAELTLIKQELEREMVKAKEDYKLQLDNEITIKMTNMMTSEIDVAPAGPLGERARDNSDNLCHMQIRDGEMIA